MSANFLPSDREQKRDLRFDTTPKLEWVVREDPKIQAELNGLSKKGQELSSKVVNKVVACIKDL
ncbi:MAG: hypothetical protein WBB69_16585 [Anaerolineales bacterium]